MKGFTLVEIMVTLVIIALSVGSFLPLFTTSRRNLLVERRYLKAMFLAQEVMEKLKYHQALDPKFNYLTMYSDPDLIDFYCRIDEQPIEKDRSRIIVSVSFREGGRDHSLALEAMFSSRETLKTFYENGKRTIFDAIDF
ncbi:MAG: type II secretion system protein [Candidatus Wallbacteria bacterium]|nr:type II secretion system protein [Candidatus Wallbacteria bacterium]